MTISRLSCQSATPLLTKAEARRTPVRPARSMRSGAGRLRRRRYRLDGRHEHHIKDHGRGLRRTYDCSVGGHAARSDGSVDWRRRGLNRNRVARGRIEPADVATGRRPTRHRSRSDAVAASAPTTQRRWRLTLRPRRPWHAHRAPLDARRQIDEPDADPPFPGPRSYRSRPSKERR